MEKEPKEGKEEETKENINLNPKTEVPNWRLDPLSFSPTEQKREGMPGCPVKYLAIFSAESGVYHL